MLRAWAKAYGPFAFAMVTRRTASGRYVFDAKLAGKMMSSFDQSLYIDLLNKFQRVWTMCTRIFISRIYAEFFVSSLTLVPSASHAAVGRVHVSTYQGGCLEPLSSQGGGFARKSAGISSVAWLTTSKVTGTIRLSTS